MSAQGFRRGKWLYHPDPYREQSPVFEVKKAAVRVTAFMDGVETNIQVLVGDNPGDPNAKWVDWRLNGQELVLTPPVASTQPITQIVVANPGWYRIDPDDLIGSNSLVWAEDQEGTLDDRIIPAHILRPACGAGGVTPPAPEDPIPVTCAQLYGLLSTASLVAGRWYAVTNATPLLDAGQRVYVAAVAADQIGENALFYGPTLTGSTLWPAKISVDSGCQLVELHDIDKNNLVRGYTTIQQWDWLANARDNVIEDSYVLVTVKGQFFGNEVRNSRVYAPTARFERNVFDQAYVWTILGDALVAVTDCTINTGGRLFATSTNGNQVGIYISNTTITEYGTLRVSGPPTSGTPIFVANARIATMGYMAISGDHYGVSSFVGLTFQGCEVDTGGYLLVRNVIGSGFSARYTNIRVLERGYANIRGVGFMSSVTVKGAGYLHHRYLNVVSPGLSWGAATLQRVEVSSGAVVTLQWHGNDVPAEPPYLLNCTFRTGAILTTSYVGRYNIQIVEMSDGSSFQYSPFVSTSTGVYLRRVKLKTASRILFNNSSVAAPNALSITDSEYHSGHLQIMNDATLQIHLCRFGSGRSFFGNLLVFNRVTSVEAGSDSALAVVNTARLGMSSCTFNFGDVLIDGSNIANDIRCDGVVVNSSQFSMLASTTPTFYGVYGVTVSGGSSLRVRHNGGQGASSSLTNSIFGGGASGDIIFTQANNTFVGLSGFYAFGESVAFTYNATATTTGLMTRNF